MKFDVTVVGAGPSGSFCAKKLAEKGFKVLLIDKEKFPREKACGGLISSKALILLQSDFNYSLLNKIESNPVHNIILTFAQRELELKKNKMLGIIVRRKKFDELLVNEAVRKGVYFIDRCEYKHHVRLQKYYEIYTTKGIFCSSFLIGADGVYSRVAKISEIRQEFSKWEMGFAVSCEVPGGLTIEKEGAEFIFTGVLGGMGWCFNGRDFVNLGVGGYALESKKILQTANQLVMERLKNKNSAFNLKAHFLPAGGRRRRIAEERIFLIGDAAGFVDPFSGEGIYFALKSGQIAADMIEKNMTASDYEKICYSKLLNEFRYSAFLSILLGDRSKYLKDGMESAVLEDFERILTVPPEKGCYKSVLSRILNYKISPFFPLLWIHSMFFERITPRTMMVRQ